MSDINSRCLDVFPEWLASLGDDVREVLGVLEKEDLSRIPREILVGGMNYAFTSLDLVPDVVADIGYVDDVFILKLTARAALESEDTGLSDSAKGILSRVAEGVELIEELLGDKVFGRLDKYARELANKGARGRTVREIAENPSVFEDFSADVLSFVEGYEAPEFSKDEKSLIKLASFLDAKLPK